MLAPYSESLVYLLSNVVQVNEIKQKDLSGNLYNMNTKIYASYLRVSTQKQGMSQLGLSSQRDICNGFIKNNGGTLGREFVDVESGTHRDRKGLLDAINYCNENNCPLVIATLSRLARDVEFCFKVVNTGIEIHFVDMPQINTLLLGVFASVAQYERELTSDRTKKALAVKKAQGCKLGAGSEKYRENYNNKTKEQKNKESMERGKMKNERHLAKRETQVFLKVLRNVFPEACADEDASNWNWKGITTRGEYTEKIKSVMIDYKELDESGNLFKKWDFTWDEKYFRTRLCAHIQNMRVSVLRNKKNNNQ